MKFAPKFSDDEMKEIYISIRANARECESEDYLQMSISDVDMSSILNNQGFAVNVKFVERTRRKLGIKPRGSLSRKFNEIQIREMEEIICYYANTCTKTWKLTISDIEMCNALCDLGYPVNVKYVERMRRSLGIEPLGERGGVNSQDQEYASLIVLHDLDVGRLSYRSTPSGALRGQSGSDIRDRFGCHTTDLDDAIKRKSKELFRSSAYKPQLRPVFSDLEENEETIENIFAEEVSNKTNNYGKKGKNGGVYNTRTAQTFTSIQ